MKSRVSHFITNNLQINSINRPVPKKCVESVIEKTNKAADSRASLANKLNLKFKSTKSRRFFGQKVKKVNGESKPLIKRKILAERQLVSGESKYAAKPEKSTSTLLQKVIKYEVELFRKNGLKGRVN